MANIRHNMYGTPTYKSWAEMKYRCGKWYWAKISYCKRWEKFENFLEDMGKRPPNTTLDRIDVYGDYCKENCRWANNEIQANNKKNNKYYNINGEKLTLSQIARKYNISRSNLANKIYIYNWDINKAINYLLERGDFYGSKKNV